MKLEIRNGEVWYNYYWHGPIGSPMADWLLKLYKLGEKTD